MMRDTPLDTLRREGRHATRETLAAVQAVRRIAQAIAASEPICVEDVEVADRILNPPVSWEGLLRTPCGEKGEAPCDPA